MKCYPASYFDLAVTKKLSMTAAGHTFMCDIRFLLQIASALSLVQVCVFFLAGFNYVGVSAMKSNDNAAILRTLLSLGCGLDVASKGELQRALALGVPKHKVVYSHTCKAPSNLLFAKQKGIKLTVFDTEDELQKIKELYPKAHIMVRIRHDDPKSSLLMGVRFGATLEAAVVLLNQAWHLGLRVVGVSFHIGSGSLDSSVNAAAIGEAKKLFIYASENGRPFTTLDIGGGFPGTMKELAVPFQEVRQINGDANFRTLWRNHTRLCAQCDRKWHQPGLTRTAVR